MRRILYLSPILSLILSCVVVSASAQQSTPSAATKVRTYSVTVPVAPSPIPPLPPAHPVTAEQVHEMMQLTGAANLMKQMLDSMMPSIRQSMPPYIPPDVLDDFERSLSGADFEGAMVRVYQAHLSTEDAVQIIAFYKTPAGEHLLAVMPEIAKDSQVVGQRLGQQVMREVLQRHQAEIEAAKEKYEAQSTPSPAQTPPAAAPDALLSLSGSGSKSTQVMDVPDEWSLSWSYDCSDFGNEGNFQVYVLNSDGSPAAAQGVNQLGNSGSDTEYFHQGGKLYLEINSECNWTIQVLR